MLKIAPLCPRPASSTARAPRPPRAAARAGLTPASASKGASATSLPIRKAFCSPSWCMRPTSKTRMAPCRCCVRCAKPFLACAMSSPTGSIAVRSCRPRSPIVAPGRSRSSSARPASKASNSCPGDGWSSVPSPGSAVAAVSPRTSRRPSPAPQPGCCWPTFDCSPAASQGLECKPIISSQTLRSPRSGRLEGRTLVIQLEDGYSEQARRWGEEAGMSIGATGRLTVPHDWHSTDYVADWIVHDTARDPERRPRLQQMLAMAPFPRDAAIEVLDVGAGYGAVTEEVLKAFPKARVTLQDYSQPMLGAARQRLASHAAQLRYVTADLTDPGWAKAVC